MPYELYVSIYCRDWKFSLRDFSSNYINILNIAPVSSTPRIVGIGRVYIEEHDFSHNFLFNIKKGIPSFRHRIHHKISFAKFWSYNSEISCDFSIAMVWEYIYVWAYAIKKSPIEAFERTPSAKYLCRSFASLFGCKEKFRIHTYI